MLPPNELKNKEFTKAMRGYNAEEVDEHISFIIDKYTELYRENDELERRLKLTQAKLEALKKDEESIRTALINAQKAGATIINEANERAEVIMRAAKTNCDRILAEFRANIRIERDNAIKLREITADFKHKLLSAYAEHIEYIEGIDTEVAALDEINITDDVLVRAVMASIRDEVEENAERLAKEAEEAERIKEEAAAKRRAAEEEAIKREAEREAAAVVEYNSEESEVIEETEVVDEVESIESIEETEDAVKVEAEEADFSEYIEEDVVSEEIESYEENEAVTENDSRSEIEEAKKIYEAELEKLREEIAAAEVQRRREAEIAEETKKFYESEIKKLREQRQSAAAVQMKAGQETSSEFFASKVDVKEENDISESVSENDIVYSVEDDSDVDDSDIFDSLDYEEETSQEIDDADFMFDFDDEASDEVNYDEDTANSFDEEEFTESPQINVKQVKSPQPQRYNPQKGSIKDQIVMLNNSIADSASDEAYSEGFVVEYDDAFQNLEGEEVHEKSNSDEENEFDFLIRRMEEQAGSSKKSNPVNSSNNNSYNKKDTNSQNKKANKKDDFDFI